MKINEQWLRHFVDPPVDCQQLAEQLTMAGLEVEGVAQTQCDIKGVVVARVVSVETHPDKQGLKLCRVDDGSGQTLTIVCAASNVQENHFFPLARTGATLPGNKKISVMKFGGIRSQGMLCSEAELGLAEASSGLMRLPRDLEPGTELSALLHTDDHILDITKPW